MQAAHSELMLEIEDAVRRVLREGPLVGGPEVAALEHEWAAFTESRHCVGVANGLDALKLALMAIGVGPGDEVIVPAHTFIATWLSVTALGADVVPVDLEPGSHLMTAAAIGEALSPRTKAIVPVHLYGDPVDLDPIMTLAERHGIHVIEDAAQAQGARYRGRRIGGHGNLVAWSFYPGKNLGAAGDAGAVSTDDAHLAARVRRLRNYGSSEKYVHDELGTNSRLDPIQAAILRVKLRRLDEWNERRAAVAAAYRAAIPQRHLLTSTPEGNPVHHLMVISLEQRDRVRQVLMCAGIETGVHYPTPPHMQGAYSELRRRNRWSFPNAVAFSRSALSLPMGPHLNLSAVDRVLDVLLPLLES